MSKQELVATYLELIFPQSRFQWAIEQQLSLMQDTLTTIKEELGFDYASLILDQVPALYHDTRQQVEALYADTFTEKELTFLIEVDREKQRRGMTDRLYSMNAELQRVGAGSLEKVIEGALASLDETSP